MKVDFTRAELEQLLNVVSQKLAEWDGAVARVRRKHGLNARDLADLACGKTALQAAHKKLCREMDGYEETEFELQGAGVKLRADSRCPQGTVYLFKDETAADRYFPKQNKT